MNFRVIQFLIHLSSIHCLGIDKKPPLTGNYGHFSIQVLVLILQLVLLFLSLTLSASYSKFRIVNQYFLNS